MEEGRTIKAEPASSIEMGLVTYASARTGVLHYRYQVVSTATVLPTYSHSKYESSAGAK